MTQACRYGNFADQSGEYFASKQYGASYVGFLGYANCDDGEPYNSIVGLYRPNPFGLFDIVGNVSQLLGSCYNDGYQARPEQETDINRCDFVAHRGSTWHYSPKPHARRGRTKKTGWTPDALVGFRLAADGHFDKGQQIDASTATFETALKQAQNDRLATRPKLPDAPKSIQLVELTDNHLTLSWQPSQDTAVKGYEIFQSHSQYAHWFGGFYQGHYDKVKTVSAAQNAVKVSLPDVGGSFRVVAVTDKLTSLPSQAGVAVVPRRQSIPGRIGMQHPVALENLHLKHLKAEEDKPEVFYLSKTDTNDLLPCGNNATRN
ncbi:MAG: SUMF1/EgtB/PvdO family nonheme iron enzyme, partial [Psychrosphaera sp.]|nr:SUMF1/EgtB/PvdO family nonheme iron enzyme [Psychrosphaera sp.]